MSIAAVMNKTYFHCRRLLLRGYYRANTYNHVVKANIFTRERVALADTKPLPPTSKRSELRNIQSRYEYARRVLVDNVLKRVTNTLAADLRRRSVRQLFNNGNPSPFFALVGISLASGTGILRRDEELEGICWEIRESIFRMRKNLYEAEECEFEENFSINSLEFGSVIAKGSYGVVYEAREKSKTESSRNAKDEDAKAKNFPLAVKMMFNYDIESNSSAILRSMYREMVPLQNVHTDSTNFWENEMADRVQRLPPHVNVVKMYRSFTDHVPELPDSKTVYPNALPQRLDPQGFGRNMSLFLVMKKYDTDLKQYLTKKIPHVRDGVVLLTQLLEAVAHINKHDIAHRDLKTDNILLDLSDGEENCPLLVVTDFGSCLSDKYYGLNLPYKTPDTDKGGNSALMAPEVVTAQAGMFSSIDYSKADVWTVGTLAYEIFTGKNPFLRYKDANVEVLRSSTYTEDMLPQLPDEVPPLISRLVRAILTKNPAKRLDAELSATICQLYLWAPSQWLQNEKVPSNSEILQWLLSLTTKVLYEGPLQYKNSLKKRTSTTEYHLIGTFLQRVKLNIVRKALDWIYT